MDDLKALFQALADLSPDLLPEALGALAEGAEPIWSEDELVGFALPQGYPTDPSLPVVEAVVVDE